MSACLHARSAHCHHKKPLHYRVAFYVSFIINTAQALHMLYVNARQAIVESDTNDIRSLRAFCALDYFKLNFLAFLECLETFGLDGRKMDEHIVLTLDGNKAVAFFRVKPFNGACLHYENPPDGL